MYFVEDASVLQAESRDASSLQSNRTRNGIGDEAVPAPCLSGNRSTQPTISFRLR